MAMKQQAYCDLDCGGCPALVATKTDDDALCEDGERVGGAELCGEPEEVNCDGCSSVSGRRWKFSQTCEVRA